jgi:hypothetical protein
MSFTLPSRRGDIAAGWPTREPWSVREQEIPKDAEANMLEIPVSVFDGVLDLIEDRPD